MKSGYRKNLRSRVRPEILIDLNSSERVGTSLESDSPNPMSPTGFGVFILKLKRSFYVTSLFRLRR